MEVIKSGKKHNSVSQTGWTCEIPSKESCRIFMINDEQAEDRLWLLIHDLKKGAEAGLFTYLFNMVLKNHPEDKEAMLADLAGIHGNAFSMNFPPTGENTTVQGMISAIARLIQYQEGFKDEAKTVRLNNKKADWSVEVLHPDTGCTFSVNTSEPLVNDGKSMPLQVWLQGDYPEVLDGFCALLSLNMAKRDLPRISAILKALTATAGMMDSMCFFNPITANKSRLSSLSSYISHLVLHRYMVNYYLDMSGNIPPEHNNVVALHGRNVTNFKQFNAR